METLVRVADMKTSKNTLLTKFMEANYFIQQGALEAAISARRRKSALWNHQTQRRPFSRSPQPSFSTSAHALTLSSHKCIAGSALQLSHFFPSATASVQTRPSLFITHISFALRMRKTCIRSTKRHIQNTIYKQNFTIIQKIKENSENATQKILETSTQEIEFRYLQYDTNYHQTFATKALQRLAPKKNSWHPPCTESAWRPAGTSAPQPRESCHENPTSRGKWSYFFGHPSAIGTIEKLPHDQLPA